MSKLTQKQYELLKHLAWCSRTPSTLSSKRTLRSLIKRGLIKAVPPERARYEGPGYVLTTRGHSSAVSERVDLTDPDTVVREYKVLSRPPKAVRRGDEILTKEGHRGHFVAFDGGYIALSGAHDPYGEPLVKLHMGSRRNNLRLIDLFTLYRELRIWAPGFDPAHETLTQLRDQLAIGSGADDEEVLLIVRGMQAKIEHLEAEMESLRKEMEDLQW